MRPLCLILSLCLLLAVHAQKPKGTPADDSQTTEFGVLPEHLAKVRTLIKSIPKATFKPIRKGWAFDYTLRPTTGILNSFEYMRSLMSYESFQKMVPAKIYLSGPHDGTTLNLTEANSFGHYNPEFLTYLQAGLDEVAKDKAFLKLTGKPLTKHGIMLNLQRMQHMHRHIEKNEKNGEEFRTLTKRYQKMLKEKSVPKGAYRRDLCPKGLGQDYWNWSETAYSFWMRREIDGTREQWIKLIDTVLESYEIEPLKF